MTDNGWHENKKLIRHQLAHMEKTLEKIDRRLTKIENKIWILQIKAAGIGGIVAFFTTFIMDKL
jgi:hypothetical protein